MAAEAWATVKYTTLANAWNKLPPSDENLQENIENWLECDVDDPGHQVLTDDEIIASVIDDQDLCDEEEEPSDEDCAEKGPSSEEAFHCLETAMKWVVEQQEECDAVQLLCLKRLRDSAAKK
ncbi:hypothetical protein C0J52_26123 [Blattella germanica]|nr:hypothetical protein C0J52_26123 [Blattella germanica]